MTAQFETARRAIFDLFEDERVNRQQTRTELTLLRELVASMLETLDVEDVADALSTEKSDAKSDSSFRG